MVFIARLLCPNGHIIAAGATEADVDESMADIARSFLLHLKDQLPEIDCSESCKFKVDLRTMCLELNVHIEATGCETTDEAAALIAEEARKVRVTEYMYRSRN